MSTESARRTARVSIETLSNLGGKIVRYIGDAGEIDTVGYISQEEDYIGIDGQIPATRNIAVLLVEDVGEPRRGDRVIDEDDVEWSLLDPIALGDPFVVEVAVQRR